MFKQEYILRRGTWVAVCDGRKALLFENKGEKGLPKFELREQFEHQNPPSHLQGSSPPGRTFNSASNRRSSVEAPDYHEQAERAFLQTFADCMDRHVRDLKIKALVLVAPAPALGLIRPMLSAATRKIIVAEVDKDYVKTPLHEIEMLLQC